MKTLPEILRDALILLKEGRENVVIARGHSREPFDGRSMAYQMRIRLDADLRQYRCEARSWLGEQWSDWRERQGWLGGAGFDIDDVLASDWRIAS